MFLTKNHRHRRQPRRKKSASDTVRPVDTVPVDDRPVRQVQRRVHRRAVGVNASWSLLFYLHTTLQGEARDRAPTRRYPPAVTTTGHRRLERQLKGGDLYLDSPE